MGPCDSAACSEKIPYLFLTKSIEYDIVLFHRLCYGNDATRVYAWVEGMPPLLFHCPKCNYRSCRKCGDDYHPDIRCDQVESKKESSGRTKVEEAMTNALVRTCPRPMCRRKFLKESGCNKMTCSCGALVCYVCNQEIPASVAYKHFCQTPHCNHSKCNKCPLYVDTTAADKTKVANAARKAARSVRKSVKVDVNAMLKDPPPPAPSRKR